MKIRYEVHSVTVDPVVVTAMLGEHEMQATVSGLTIELVSLEDVQHGHTFRIVPKTENERADYQAMFQPGKKITATFTAEGDLT